jgi:hypothetical protein
VSERRAANKLAVEADCAQKRNRNRGRGASSQLRFQGHEQDRASVARGKQVHWFGQAEDHFRAFFQLRLCRLLNQHMRGDDAGTDKSTCTRADRAAEDAANRCATTRACAVLGKVLADMSFGFDAALIVSLRAWSLAEWSRARRGGGPG